MLYTTVLNAFTGSKPIWKDPNLVWKSESGSTGGAESLDQFLHSLRSIKQEMERFGHHRTASSGRHIPIDQSEDAEVSRVKMVLVIENAERLAENLPFLVTPLTRLGELVCLYFQV